MQVYESDPSSGRYRANGGSWSVYNNLPGSTTGYRGSMTAGPGSLYATYNGQYTNKESYSGPGKCMRSSCTP